MGHRNKNLPLHANELLSWFTSAHGAVLPLKPPSHTSGLPHIQQSHSKKKQYKKNALSLYEKTTDHPPAYFLSSAPSSPLGNAKIPQKPQALSLLLRKSQKSHPCIYLEP